MDNKEIPEPPNEVPGQRPIEEPTPPNPIEPGYSPTPEPNPVRPNEPNTSFIS